MATIELALPYVEENEGEFAFTVGDVGGETLDGIARRMHPEWPGWVIVDSLNLPFNSRSACDHILTIDSRIEPLVAAFYLKEYWCYNGILYQPVATKLLDGAVNMQGNGRVGAAIVALQRAVAVQFPAVRLTPGYGPNTEVMVNKCDGDGLLMDLARFYTAHYNAILDAHPSYEKFKNGWLARAQKLPPAVAA